MEPKQRVAFHTFGCRLNQYDTESIRTLLERSDRFETVKSREPADIHVVNTCSVTHRADASARKAIRRIHNEYPNAKIVVTGCYAQRAPGEIAELHGVSLVVGAPDRANIVSMVDSIPGRNTPVAVSDISEAKAFLDVPITEMMERSRAYVKVQEGCNESCTFCIIPQTRGASRSRAHASVLDQVRDLVASGYTEIVLTGVHLGDYGLDLIGERSLGRLVRDIVDIPELVQFRLSSIEPASVSEELIELVASSSKFARHFHIPFQSGSDRILERMQRRYDSVGFRNLIERLAAAIPQCGIGTDVICGFPGETDDDFQKTFDMLESLPITYIHPFTYSPRPGSAAADFGDEVDGETKKRRVRALKRLSTVKSEWMSQRMLGERLKVIPEVGADRDWLQVGETVIGWSDNYVKVRFEVAVPIPAGHRVEVEALSADGAMILGRAARDRGRYAM
jgi:threonylcarbamoyladenosine tRNA methylthiotransferase MtaB